MLSCFVLYSILSLDARLGDLCLRIVVPPFCRFPAYCCACVAMVLLKCETLKDHGLGTFEVMKRFPATRAHYLVPTFALIPMTIYPCC